ncbi:hypothetical protein [Streptosporangium fragile]|uniref:hypothetical protein n=1 Tax=Streptosporangium fragile TaxID=46186 RepID=UPI0031E5349D
MSRSRGGSPGRRWGSVVAALLIGALPACGTGASGTTDPSPAREGSRSLVLPPPEKAGPVKLTGMWPFLTREELLDRHPHVRGATVEDAVQVRYEEVKRAKGHSLTRGFIFTGYDVRISRDQEAPTVEHALQTFLAGDTPDHAFDLPAGPFGGHARCVGLELVGSETGMCAWADDGTVGVILGPNFSAAEFKEMLPGFRAAVER